MNKFKTLISAVTFSLCIGSAFAAEDAPVDKVLVKINGVDISQQELQYFIAKQPQQVDPQRALAEMINVELLAQAARNDGTLQDPDLVLEIKQNKSALIASHYLQNILQQLEISEDDLQKRYQQEYVDAESNREYNADHILLETEEQALDIIKQLDEGADFAELAKASSIGPSGKNGGALDWFKPADMVEPFSQAAIALDAGSYSKQPVKTRFGWHVIRLNESRPVEPPTFDSVRKQLSTTIAAEAISNKLKALHDEATIEFID